MCLVCLCFKNSSVLEHRLSCEECTPHDYARRRPCSRLVDSLCLRHISFKAVARQVNWVVTISRSTRSHSVAICTGLFMITQRTAAQLRNRKHHQSQPLRLSHIVAGGGALVAPGGSRCCSLVRPKLEACSNLLCDGITEEDKSRKNALNSSTATSMSTESSKYPREGVPVTTSSRVG